MTMEIVRNHKDFKLLTNKARGNYLVPEPNHHTTKSFFENLLVKEMRTHKMDKPIYLGLSILKMNKTMMYEFWNDYLKLK